MLTSLFPLKTKGEKQVALQLLKELQLSAITPIRGNLIRNMKTIKMRAAACVTVLSVLAFALTGSVASAATNSLVFKTQPASSGVGIVISNVVVQVVDGKGSNVLAVQNAGALTDAHRTARSVLECASPLALWRATELNAKSQSREGAENGGRLQRPLRLCAFALKLAGRKSTAAGAMPKTATGTGALPGNVPANGRAQAPANGSLRWTNGAKGV